MIREDNFWRGVGVTLGILIALCIVVNLLRENTVPQEITLLLSGSLIALGVGYTIASPRASTIRLSSRDEQKFRKRQYAVSFVFSTVLALTLLVREVRESTLLWLIIPILILPLIIIIREYFKPD